MKRESNWSVCKRLWCSCFFLSGSGDRICTKKITLLFPSSMHISSSPSFVRCVLRTKRILIKSKIYHIDLKGKFYPWIVWLYTWIALIALDLDAKSVLRPNLFLCYHGTIMRSWSLSAAWYLHWEWWKHYTCFHYHCFITPCFHWWQQIIVWLPFI